MTERTTHQKHEKRRLDSEQIRDSGKLVASAAAAISLITNSAPAVVCVAFREKALEEFNKGTRDYRIKSILHIENFLTEHSEVFHPNARDSELAFQTRRLEVISRIVKSDIADGQLAVDTADLLLGAYHFTMEGNELYREWEANASFIREWQKLGSLDTPRT